MFVAGQSTGAGYTVGLVVMLAASLYSLRRLDGLVDLRGWLRRRVAGD